jgi:hypothetical protein
LDETKLLDRVFKDPLVKAMEAMEAKAMIPEEHLAVYRKNPQLLEDDKSKTPYFFYS